MEGIRQKEYWVCGCCFEMLWLWGIGSNEFAHYKCWYSSVSDYCLWQWAEGCRSGLDRLCQEGVSALRADFQNLQLALAHNLLFISPLISLYSTLSSFILRYKSGTKSCRPFLHTADLPKARKRGTHICNVPRFRLTARCLGVTAGNKKRCRPTSAPSYSVWNSVCYFTSS